MNLKKLGIMLCMDKVRIFMVDVDDVLEHT